jgi:acyl carrier protein
MESTMTLSPVSTETLAKLKAMVLGITQMKISLDQVSDSANLFNDCGLDSTSVVELVVALEQEFDITIDEDELDVDLFQNIGELARFVEMKRAQNA